MLSSAKLKEIVSEARPIIERQLDDSERIAGFRDMVSANGGDWSALKALIKAQIQDERDDSGEGKRVRKILEKAEYSTDYAELLGWSNMNEQNFSADDEDFDPSTGEITEPLPPKAAGQGLAEPALMLGSSQPANIKSAPITERQDAPHPASDLTTPPSLSGQVAPIQESPRKAAEAEGESPARQDDASASAATSDRTITTNVSVRIEGVTSQGGENPASNPMYAAPGVVTTEHTPPEPVKRHPISAAFADLGQDRQELQGAIFRRAGGVAKPIVKIGNLILDGWARYDIARGLHIDYPVVQYDGTDLLADAINWNLESRDLSAKEIQTVITRLVKLYPDREQEILGMFDAEIAEAAE